MENVLEIKNLTKKFGSFTAVDSISFTVKAGEVFGLLGPNCAGKTTTIKMLTTLLKPSSGLGLISGYEIGRNSPEVRRNIGYVSQMISVDGSLTGYENLLIFARLYDIPRRERRQAIENTLSLLGLTEVAGSLVKTYSGGMIRKLEIGQAFMHLPKVLFLDEPTVGLDPVARRNVWSHLRELREKYQMSILITTHYMEEAEELCDRLAIMHLGKIVAEGTPAELKRQTGREGAILEDAFAYFTGANLENGGGNWRDTIKTRRTAGRLG
ncbi:MAG: ATP-binding cassette domain-containing protein [Bacillota bacterium]